MKKIKKVVFRSVGTNFNAYVDRFIKKYIKGNSFTMNKKGNHNIEILQNGEVIDKFTSLVTFRQFLEVMVSLEFIDKGSGKYYILKKVVDYDEMTNIIFTKDDDKKINILRQSRIISFLYAINYINSKNIKDFKIKGLKGLLHVENITKETSRWEYYILKDLKRISRVSYKVLDWHWVKY